MDPSSLKYYNQHASQLAQEYHSAEVTGLHTMLSRWIPSGAEVLEIGCGAGRDAAFLASLGCKVTATDASEKMLEYSHEYLTRVGGGDSVNLLQADFPVQSNHLLLNRRYDAIVSMAVLMHIPDNELFEFAFQIRTILKQRGLFICSFCIGREPSAKDPRLFVNREAAEVQLFFERIGFRLLFTEDNQDGLGRDIQWVTLIFESEGSLTVRPVDQIEAIINRDRKSATYKLALFRSLCEIAQTEYRNVKWHRDNRVSLPLGLIVEKWLFYYWPLIEAHEYSGALIPQLSGFEKNKQIKFRGQLAALISLYKLRGGLNAFSLEFRTGILSLQTKEALKAAINAIASAIVTGPVRYSGGSLESSSPFFTFEGQLNLRQFNTRDELSSELGRIFFDASIWREMCLVGHWIAEAIVLRWAELVHQFSEQTIPIPTILTELLKTPEENRDVLASRLMYGHLPNIHCTWSNKRLTGERFDIDHIIPFSLWHNNDLWNLVPADKKINSQKRDRIISRKTLQNSEERLIHYWRIQNDQMPLRFQTEIQRTLLGKPIDKTNWEKPTLSALSETIELVALHRGVERWETNI